MIKFSKLSHDNGFSEDFSLSLLLLSSLTSLHISEFVESLEAVHLDFRCSCILFSHRIERFSCQFWLEVTFSHLFLNLFNLIVKGFRLLVRSRWLCDMCVVLIDSWLERVLSQFTLQVL